MKLNNQNTGDAKTPAPPNLATAHTEGLSWCGRRFRLPAAVGFAGPPVLLTLLAALVSSAPAPREQVGPLPDGGFLLNSGWRIQAAGKQVPVDTFPMSSALSPDGKYLLVLNGGYNPPSISV